VSIAAREGLLDVAQDLVDGTDGIPRGVDLRARSEELFIIATVKAPRVVLDRLQRKRRWRRDLWTRFVRRLLPESASISAPRRLSTTGRAAVRSRTPR